MALACSEAEQLLEFVADDVDVDRDGRVLKGRQADPKGTLDERRAILGLALGDDRRQGRVSDDEAFDDDPLAVDADLAGRELNDAGFHGRIVGPRCDS